MSVTEPLPAPEASQERVRQLVKQLAQRIQARRLAGTGTGGTSEGSSSDEVAGGPVRSESPTAAQVRSSGQRALLCQLLVGDRAPIRGARAGSGAHGRR